MGETAANVATTCTEIVVNLGMKELPYLCCYNSYAEDFESTRGKLLAEMKSVHKEIEEAKTRNETEVEPVVQHWLIEGEKIIQKDTKPNKWFGLCINCFSQYPRAKELESATMKDIPRLLEERKTFPRIARSAAAPGMAYYSQDFMEFESRRLKFNRLIAVLKDENNHIIGLQGIGGSGKTTMAIQAGTLVESKPFDQVIFISVSTPMDEKRIRDDIAKKLGLPLKEEKQLEHAQQIWTRITNAGKILIILDDVWEKLDLKKLGIQPSFHHTGTCNVLLTTRYKNVCTKMGCQKSIQLAALPKNDALDLFLFHAIKNGKDCPEDSKKVALDIVNECGRLPVIVVAVAKTLRDLHTNEWGHALTALKSNEPSSHEIDDEDAMRFYNSLKLSYAYLKDEKAQVLFLLSAIFPKAYQIPIELLSKIAIGLRLFGEVDNYCTARSQVHMAKNKLINSSLLLKAGEERVKMHDVIRKVAMEIANKEIQVIEDSKKKLKENMKYSSWIIDDFSNCFDGSKLEVLLIWINEIGSLKVPSGFFRSMKSLRVLFLFSKIEFGRTSALSLLKSIQLLENIITLSLTNWELGDISLLKNLQMLEILELINCSIIELPNGVSELKKLRFLGLIHCSIEGNNPFEVIARCSQLEELYYVLNEDHMLKDEEVSQITFLPEYQRYHIDGGDFSDFYSLQLDASIKKSFKPAKLQRIFSKEMIKSLAARVEILELKGDIEMGQNSLIPGIVSMEHGAMNDVIKLSLTSWSEIKCLGHAENPQLKSSVNVFSKLVELQLVKVDISEICCGRYPAGFLKQLEKLELKDCQMLESTLFKGELELGNLKSIEINNCSMACIFHLSIAQTLKQLATLKIKRCSELKCILRDEGSSIEEKVDDKESNPKSSHESMFPKLKLLHVTRCKELEFIFPVCLCEDLPLLESVKISECDNIKYIFGQYPREGELYQMQKEIILRSLKAMSIEDVPEFVDIYPECRLPKKSIANTSEVSKVKDKSPSRNVAWGPLCCFLPKSSTSNKDDISMSKATQSDSTTSQELKEEKYVGNAAYGIFTPPLYPFTLREMKIGGITKLTSLFTVSIASSLKSLEKLEVRRCDTLEHIVTDERHYGHDDDMNANSIFPNLHSIEIYRCDKLKSIFPASCSTSLVHLQSVLIEEARELKYMFGKSYGDDNSLDYHNHDVEIHLLALTKLCLKGVPNMVRVCPEHYYVTAFSLNDISFGLGCPQLAITSLTDLSVGGHKGQEQLSRKEVIGMRMCSLKHLALASLDLEVIFYQRLEIASLVNSCLETLSLDDLDNLKNICVGPKNYLRFQNLFKLTINDCNQLKFILPSSISRSLPYLRHLEVSDCEELERIIEDDDDDDDDPHHQECFFPNLHRIIVTDCEMLKCLFSLATSGRLPQLSMLMINDAIKLEQVFGWKQGTTEKLVIKDYFPKLFVIVLNNLPNLHYICPGIDFQTVIYRHVENCPKISLTSINFDFAEGYEDWFRNSESEKGNMDVDNLFEQFLERLREVSEKAIKRDWLRVDQDNGSPNLQIKKIAEASVQESPKSEEAVKADEINDSEECNKLAPFAIPTQIESLQSERGLDLHPKEQQSKPSNSSSHKASAQDNLVRKEGKGKRITPDQEALPKAEPDMHPDDSQKLIDDNNNPEASVGEGLQPEKYDKASSTTPSDPEVACRKESMHDQEALEESMMANEAPNQRKPQMATSASHREPAGSLQSDMDISNVIELAQETMIPSVQEGSKLDEAIEANQIMNPESSKPSPTEYATPSHEGKVERITLDHQALPQIEPDMHADDSEKVSSISNDLKPQNITSTLQADPSGSKLKPSDISSKTTSAQGPILLNQAETCTEEDDLIRLLRMMKEGAHDNEVEMPCVPEIAAFDDNKLSEAVANLESSLKMDLNQIAISEEHIHRLENALTFLSTYCSDNGPLFHGLRLKIDSLHQEIKTTLSSFKQASATIYTLNKLEEKEKLIDEKYSQQMEAATTLVSEISNTKKSMAELKEEISKLQVELNSKDKEFKDSEVKLSSLEQQKEEQISDTMRLMEEYEVVKKDKSRVVEGQTKARKEVEKVKNDWPSCVANLRKTTHLLAILLKRKL
ncbi:uncharacterized protein LOC129285700 isoform X4 [Prosopis cineraria]|uniref:uncharacterized protein LOC129285700 isoform X4 n=1 Tax=Prosopis cineraria TaxID=364024 RepID=UPI00240EBC47|nr:uncharacterized protein LOC129285700 isoform X4 [Prosopis cineraria]